MLYLNNKALNYRICSHNNEQHKCCFSVHTTTNQKYITLTKTEFVIWTIIIHAYNNQMDISDIEIADKICKQFKIPLNSIKKTTHYVNRCIYKFVRLKMIIVL